MAKKDPRYTLKAINSETKTILQELDETYQPEVWSWFAIFVCFKFIRLQSIATLCKDMSWRILFCRLLMQDKDTGDVRKVADAVNAVNKRSHKTAHLMFH